MMVSPRVWSGLLCLLWLLQGGTGSTRGFSQTLPETSLPSLLTPDSQAVLDKLNGLSALPQPRWCYHAGDLAHGESPTLDDVSWPAATRSLPAGALWLRATVEIPKTLNGYDLSGTQISFHLRIDTARLPEIVYFNGRRVAMGPDLEPIVLFADARPGDKVLVAVKLPPSEEPKGFRGSELTIQFAPNRPNPEDVRKQIVSAGLLLPSLNQGDRGGDRGSSEKLQSIVHDIDTKALDQANQTAFDDSLRRAQAGLMTLRPELQKADIHLTGNAHIDAAWLWPSTETVEVVRQTFATALQLMNEYPRYTYTQSAAAYDEWVEQKNAGFDKVFTILDMVDSVELAEHNALRAVVRVTRQGYDYNYRFTAMQVSPHAGSWGGSLSFVKADPENVVVTAMKKTEEGDGLPVRFYEWAGKGGNITLNSRPALSPPRRPT